MGKETLNFTTILGELSPEMADAIKKHFNRTTNLPDNVYQEGRLISSSCAIRRVETEPDFYMPLHIHDFLVFTYCRQSEGYEYLIGSNRYQLHDGNLILIPHGVPHRPIPTENAKRPFIRDEFWLRKDFLRSFGQRLPDNFLENLDNPYLFSGSGELWEEISRLYEKGVRETEQQAFRWDTVIGGYARVLLVSITRGILEEKTHILKSEQPNLFDKVIAYLKENLSEKITPEDVAKAFFVSKSTLNRTFRKHMGTSFSHGLTQLRLLAAQQLIIEGNALEWVSSHVGYADYPTFYRAFKNEFGISPRQYKKEVAK